MGCSNVKMSQLTRVDIREINSDQSYGEDKTITDNVTVDLLRKTFEETKWEQNVEVKMSRVEDVEATLFFDFDKNMPERLVVYSIWFNQSNETATTIDRDENLFGTLDTKNAQTLKDVFSQN